MINYTEEEKEILRRTVIANVNNADNDNDDNDNDNFPN